GRRAFLWYCRTARMERTPGTGQTAVPGFFKLLASNPKNGLAQQLPNARASSESFTGLTSLPVSFHFGPRREFITMLCGAGGCMAARGQRAAASDAGDRGPPQKCPQNKGFLRLV